jgi:superfamily I DNA/RNA helicase
LEDECVQIVDTIKAMHQGEMKTKYKDIAILTRTNKNAAEFEKYLITAGIPYELHPSAHKFLNKKEVKIAFHYLVLLQRPDDFVALENVLDTLDGFGEKA